MTDVTKPLNGRSGLTLECGDKGEGLTEEYGAPPLGRV